MGGDLDIAEEVDLTDFADADFLDDGVLRIASCSAFGPMSVVEAVDAAAMNRYWHVCPAFVVELRSPTDRLTALREKMQEWVENGAELAWLVDPERRVVEVYRAGREPETVSGVEFVEGEGPVVGFRLGLGRVWEPLGKR